MCLRKRFMPASHISGTLAFFVYTRSWCESEIEYGENGKLHTMYFKMSLSLDMLA